MALAVYPTIEVNETWLTLVSFTKGVNLETHQRFKAYFNGRRKQSLNHIDALNQAKTLLIDNLPKVEFSLSEGL